MDQEVYCPNCGNSEESDFSYQFWATWLITKSCFSQIYICDKCNQYVATIKNGDGYLYYINISEDDVDRYIKDSFNLG